MSEPPTGPSLTARATNVQWAYGYANRNQQWHVNAAKWSGTNSGHALSNEWSCLLPRAGNPLREQLSSRAGLGFVPHIGMKGPIRATPLLGGPNRDSGLLQADYTNMGE
uniref:Uncharacterized protein n=1 Tax=Amphimedon queenslandica TaxID=400682 RepID=A0A1X7TDD3_AMPQE